MGFLPDQTIQTLKDSLGTFVLCVFLLACAISLTFLEDWAVENDRPGYIIYGIEYFAVASFVADGLIFTFGLVKLVIKGYRELRYEVTQTGKAQI